MNYNMVKLCFVVECSEGIVNLTKTVFINFVPSKGLVFRYGETVLPEVDIVSYDIDSNFFTVILKTRHYLSLTKKMVLERYPNFGAI